MLLFYMFLEMYRSGYNENDSKSFWLLKATWVRIPPSPPNKKAQKKNKFILCFFIFDFNITYILLYYYFYTTYLDNKKTFYYSYKKSADDNQRHFLKF